MSKVLKRNYFKVELKMFKLVLIVVIFVSSCKSQSACPENFQYVKDGVEVQGLITFEDPDPVAEINLKIQLSIAVSLPSVSGKTTHLKITL